MPRIICWSAIGCERPDEMRRRTGRRRHEPLRLQLRHLRRGEGAHHCEEHDQTRREGLLGGPTPSDAQSREPTLSRSGTAKPKPSDSA